MQLPFEAPVMTLRNATLFPQALLPLYIFEPRFRKMLADVLHSHRMFIVALQKPGRTREVPSPVAGLGLIRVSVSHRDGTSHLVLQGLARVHLTDTVRYRPYRVNRIEPLPTPSVSDVTLDALTAKVRELVGQHLKQGVVFPFSASPPGSGEDLNTPNAALDTVTARDVLAYLGRVTNPGQLADMVACALLPGAVERQRILETVEPAARLRLLIQFLARETARSRKPHPD